MFFSDILRCLNTYELVQTQVVARWVNSLNRGNKRLNDSSHGNIPRGPSLVSSTAAGRPPRKDANEMSISMESSGRSSAPIAAAAGLSHSSINSGSSVHSEDLLAIAREREREKERDRMQLSNSSINPFTSSGSFTFGNSSASFSVANSSSINSSSSGGVAAAGNVAAAAASARGYGSHQNIGTVASRYRMAYDIGGGAPPEEDEYEEDDFEEDVERYDNYDYKQDGKGEGRGYK